MESEGSLPLSQVSSILSHPDPVHAPTPTSWRTILILFSIYAWVLQVVAFSQVSPPKPYIRLSPIRATCPVHVIFLDLITRTVLAEYRSLSSSCSFLHSSVNPVPLRPKYSPQHPQPTLLPHLHCLFDSVILDISLKLVRLFRFCHIDHS